jgi:putative methionine-R-sulfoxide reductase with GAF domain
MSRFDLRDISARLTRARDIQSVVFEFLSSLEATRPDWRASVAFYDVHADGFVDVYETEGNRVVRRHIVVPANELPDRLVRKLFDASAIFNAKEKRSIFSGGLGTAPCYVADERDASELMPLTVLADWKSCVCMPLGDQSDLIGILVITSNKKGAFGGRAMSEILPVKSLVTVAMLKHLRRADRQQSVTPAVEEAKAAVREAESVTETAAELRAQLAALSVRSREAEEEERERNETLARLAREEEERRRNEQASLDSEIEERERGEKLASLTREFEERQRRADQYREELERVKATMELLEAQAISATEHLSETYAEMNTASWEMADLERRVDFSCKFLMMLGEAPDDHRLASRVVSWLCTAFSIERCSLMTLDESGEMLQILAQVGLEPAVAQQVRVRIGQGVAGWVAHNRKPLLVRMRSQADITPEQQAGTYNSPSFIAVPVVHNGRLYGVVNLSNKENGELFTGVDFDCASIAGAALAVRLAGCAPSHGVAARAA